MKINVVNSAGQIVNTLDLGAQPAGTVPVTWTPVDSSGNALPAGTYTITATGTVNGAAGTGDHADPGHRGERRAGYGRRAEPRAVERQYGSPDFGRGSPLSNQFNQI